MSAPASAYAATPETLNLQSLPSDLYSELMEEQAEINKRAIAGGITTQHAAEYLQIWERLPEPRTNWVGMSSLVTTTLNSIYMFLKDAQNARTWLDTAWQVYGKKSGRLGLWEREYDYEREFGDDAKAYEWVDQAFKEYGKRVFDGRYGDEIKEFYESYDAAKPSLEILPAGDDNHAAEGKQLPADKDAKAEELWEEGQRLADQEVHQDAAESFLKALQVLDEPRSQWALSTRLYGSLCISLYEFGFLDEAIAAAQQALLCPRGADDAENWLVLGMAQADAGNKKEAKQSLKKARELGGDDVFEDVEAKYKKLAR